MASSQTNAGIGLNAVAKKKRNQSDKKIIKVLSKHVILQLTSDEIRLL